MKHIATTITFLKGDPIKLEGTKDIPDCHYFRGGKVCDWEDYARISTKSIVIELVEEEGERGKIPGENIELEGFEGVNEVSYRPPAPSAKERE